MPILSGRSFVDPRIGKGSAKRIGQCRSFLVDPLPILGSAKDRPKGSVKDRQELQLKGSAKDRHRPILFPKGLVRIGTANPFLKRIGKDWHHRSFLKKGSARIGIANLSNFRDRSIPKL